MPSTWTTGLPTGTTKIRMLPTIAQDRWINIQLGEVPSERWQLARRAGNPPSVATTGQIFTKDGGSSTSELYFKDDAAPTNTTQLTRAGGIGAPAQAVNGSTYITLESDLVTTYTNTQDGFCSAAGRIDSAGGIQAQYKIGSAVRNSTGNYSVFYSTNLKTAQGYVINITPRELSDTTNPYVCNVVTQAANHFTVKFLTWTGGAWVSADVGFMFSVFMSRI